MTGKVAELCSVFSIKVPRAIQSMGQKKTKKKELSRGRPSSEVKRICSLGTYSTTALLGEFPCLGSVLVPVYLFGWFDEQQSVIATCAFCYKL